MQTTRGGGRSDGQCYAVTVYDPDDAKGLARFMDLAGINWPSTYVIEAKQTIFLGYGNAYKEAKDWLEAHAIGKWNVLEFMFNLVASSGEVVCTSQMYSSLAAARNGIDSVRRNAGAGIEDQTAEGYEKLKYPKWEVYEDKAGEARFRMTASNGETINHRRRFFFFKIS